MLLLNILTTLYIVVWFITDKKKISLWLIFFRQLHRRSNADDYAADEPVRVVCILCVQSIKERIALARLGCF